jgi:hypothetical protein
MLVILSGVETIHKKFFARKILAALNRFVIDGYTVDFTVEPFQISDSEGNIVYRVIQENSPAITSLLIDEDNEGIARPEGNATFDKVNQLYNDLLLDGGRDNHFSNFFIDFSKDIGVTEITDYSNSKPKIPLLHPHSYADVLANYANKLGDVHVITGIFSKTFIDAIRNDIGAENVTVINIIRNPSTCALLNQKEDSYYLDLTKNRTPELDYSKLGHSLVNAAILARYDDINTIKFEDIIQNGKFIVNGIEIGVPVGYSNYNSQLTTWEHTNIIPLEIVSSEMLESVNTAFQQYAVDSAATINDELLTYVNSLRHTPITLSEFTNLVLNNLPNNLFNELGYQPLSYEEIIN